MIYEAKYKTPDNFSNIIMNSNGEYLTGLYFEESKKYLKTDLKEIKLPIFQETKRWLDIYFNGEDPKFTPKYKIENITPFRQEVINVLKTIPFGKTITYSEISKIVAQNRGIQKMSSQATGGAVGWNPIYIIIPCHRVVGKNGNLTGYGGGIQNKIELLKHEKNDMSKFFLPKEGTLLCKDVNGAI